MEEFYKLEKRKNGTTKIIFQPTGIYFILSNHLKIGYLKLAGKGRFIQRDSNGIKNILFADLVNKFVTYLEACEEEWELTHNIGFRDLMNEFLSQRPIRLNNALRTFLSYDFEISTAERHQLLLKLDPRYYFEKEKEALLAFFEKNQFIQGIDNKGNFFPNQPIWYKQLNESSFLVFNLAHEDRKLNKRTVDFWKVHVDKPEKFLQKKLRKDQNENLKLTFRIFRDEKLYNQIIS